MNAHELVHVPHAAALRNKVVSALSDTQDGATDANLHSGGRKLFSQWPADLPELIGAGFGVVSSSEC